MNPQPKPEPQPMPGATSAAPHCLRGRVPVLEATSLSWPSPIEVQLWRP